MDALLESYQQAVAVISAVLTVAIPLILGVVAVNICAGWAINMLSGSRTHPAARNSELSNQELWEWHQETSSMSEDEIRAYHKGDWIH